MKIGGMNHPNADPIKEIEWLAINGFDFVDFTYEPFSFEIEADQIKELLKKAKMDIVGHTNPSLPLVYPLPSIQEAAFEELKKSFRALADLGTKKVNIHPYLNPPHTNKNELIETNLQLIKKANDYCEKLGIILMLENVRDPFNDPVIFKKILQEIPGLKMHLDVGHCNINKDLHELLKGFLKEIGDDIIHIHIHDNNGKSDEHLPIGCGDVDWQEIINIIKASGYDDTITLEVFCSDDDFLRLSKEKLIKYWF